MSNIRRAFDWIGRVFDIRGPGRSPAQIRDEYVATFDAFGSHRLPEVQNIAIAGGLGLTEVVHGPVPAGRWRHYLSVFALHDDPAGQFLTPIRIVPTLGVFPQMPIQNDVFQAAFVGRAARNVCVPPLSFVGFRTFAMAPGAQIFFSGLFVEMDVGEYPSWGPEGGF